MFSSVTERKRSQSDASSLSSEAATDRGSLVAKDRDKKPMHLGRQGDSNC